MRRMIESTLVSADGVIGEPHLWTGNSFREKAGAYALERLRHVDAMLMGRRTTSSFRNSCRRRPANTLPRSTHSPSTCSHRR
jgi:hypothetical protein